MPSIDSKEIDDALDAVRVDLHQEAQQRDELLAQQFEQELQRSPGRASWSSKLAITSTSTDSCTRWTRSGTGSLSWTKCIRTLASEAPG